MEKENIVSKMVMFTKVIGEKERKMVKVKSNLKIKVKVIKETGKMDYLMDLGLTILLMVMFMKVSLKMEKKKEKVK